MKKVLVLGTKNYDFDLYYEFKNIGLNCYFCGNKKSNLIPIENWIKIDYTYTKSIIKFLEKNPDFEYLIPGSNDLAYISICEVLKKIEFKHKIQIDCLETAKNYLMKTRFRSQKILGKVFIPKILDLKNIENEKKKFVLKEDKMSGGKGVHIFENGENFKNNFNRVLIKENFVIEEYIDGSGHGISYVVKDDKIIFEFYDDEYYCKDKLAVVATSTPSSLRIEEKQNIKEFCLNYFKLYGLTNGFFHIQCIKKEKDIYILECTRRLPGDYYHEFSSLSLGCSYLTIYIDSFIGKQQIYKVNKVFKNIVRIVLDEFINSKIDECIELQSIIKHNLVKRKKLDGFRFGENKQKYLKKEALFLEFRSSLESKYFCKKLFQNI